MNKNRWPETYETLFMGGCRTMDQQSVSAWETEICEAFGKLDGSAIQRACRAIGGTGIDSRRPPTCAEVIEEMRRQDSPQVNVRSFQSVFESAMRDIRDEKDPARRWDIMCRYEVQYGRRDVLPGIGDNILRSCEQNGIEVKRFVPNTDWKNEKFGDVCGTGI
jgi:hypothetical protein